MEHIDHNNNFDSVNNKHTETSIKADSGVFLFL